MRTTRPLALFLLLLSLSLTGFAQGGSPSAPLNPGPTAPIPSDPHEIATGETQVGLAPSERSSVLALIERAREKSDLTFAGSAAFALDVSFDASSQPQSSAPSSGKIQETWLDPQHWQWTAQLGGYSQTRLFLDGKAYDENVTSPLPLRLQMARDAIFWPAPAAGRLLVRTTSASWDGKNVTCVLTSGGGSMDATPGRRWVESEWCIDPQSGLLQILSLVPGLYAVYCESFNGKLRDECLNGEIFYSLREAQVVIEKWRVDYNTKRPHSALGYRPPAPAACSPLVPPNPISQPMAVM